jgi:hypothetical protein
MHVVCFHSDHSRIGGPEQTCDATHAVELIALKLEVFSGEKVSSMRQYKGARALSTKLL